MAALTQTINPIEWQEVQHQYRNISAFVQRWWVLGPFSLVLAVVVVALTLREITSPTRDLAIYTIWIVHALTGARAISAGANAISREHVGKTWDSLILTGISARQILLGKWLAVLRRTAPLMVLLGTLRLVMLPILMMALVNRFAWRMAYGRLPGTGPAGSSGIYNTYYEMTGISWVPWAAAVAVLMTIVLTVLEVMACTAIGLALSAITRRGWLATIGAFCVRFTPVILFAAFTRYEVGAAPSWRVLSFTPLALADSGTASLYQLVLPYTYWTERAHTNALPGVILAAGLLLLMLGISLAVAWASVRRAGALPHEDGMNDAAYALGRNRRAEARPYGA